MVTAWSSSRMPWTRSSAGPLRVLWVAVLLLAFVYAHVVSADCVAAHLGPKVTAHTAAAEHRHAVDDTAVDDAESHGKPMEHPDGGHGPSHPAQDCVPGPPQQGPALDAPAARALVVEHLSPMQGLGAIVVGDAASAELLPASATRATVLRI